ncbi:MAG TPA: DUF6599 family protein [Cyclobacteriaceae bacterium]|nr:DUF6599 family protein [Cyclobacteriaceae bacterium]
MHLQNFSIFLILLLSAKAPINVWANGYEPDIFPGLPGWKLSKKILVYEPANLFDYINGAADGFNSYDFEGLKVGEYIKQRMKIKAEVYRHSNANNGFGIYSSERFPDYTFISIGGQAYTSENVLNMVCGRYYVKLFAETGSEEEKASMIALAKLISRQLDPDATLPGLIDFFPGDGKIENTEQFINRSFLGYEFLSQAFTADYSGDDANYKLFIMDCASEDKARATLVSYLEFIKQDAGLIDKQDFVINDKYNGPVYTKWSGRYILGCLNADNADRAGKKLDEMNKNITGE